MYTDGEMSSTPSTADVFRAISDPTRRAILAMLGDADRSVTELAEPFRMTQPAVSQHLRILRDAGLVSAAKSGRQRLYRINPLPLKEVYDWVGHYERFWNQKLDALGRFLEETQ